MGHFSTINICSPTPNTQPYKGVHEGIKSVIEKYTGHKLTLQTIDQIKHEIRIMFDVLKTEDYVSMIPNYDIFINPNTNSLEIKLDWPYATELDKYETYNVPVAGPINTNNLIVNILKRKAQW